MDKRTRAFEDFMLEYFEEPDWDEGYSRADMYDAFIAGIEHIMKKDVKKG